MEYCKWLNNLFNDEIPIGLIMRLPTEAEWKKAARSTVGREYPWGNQFDESKCNSVIRGKGYTISVGSYSPQGDSPYGCSDMSGNVWEWTHSLQEKYPYRLNDGREDETDVNHRRILRGGSFLYVESNFRSAYRNALPQTNLAAILAFVSSSRRHCPNKLLPTSTGGSKLSPPIDTASPLRASLITGH